MTRLIAAGAGAALMLTLFLPWYGGTVEESVRPGDVPKGRFTGVRTVIEDGSAWGYLEVTDILVALAAIAIVGLVMIVDGRRALIAAAAVALVAGGLIAYRAVVTPPPPYSVASLGLGVPPGADTADTASQRTGPARRYGIFLAFAAAITATGAAGLAAARRPD